MGSDGPLGEEREWDFVGQRTGVLAVGLRTRLARSTRRNSLWLFPSR